MDSFIVLSVFFTIAVVLCTVSGIYCWSSFDERKYAPGCIAIFVSIALCAAGLVMNVVSDGEVEWETGESQDVELAAFSARDIEGSDIGYEGDMGNVYAYFENDEGFDSDYYYVVVPKAGRSADYKLCRLPRKNVEVVGLENGEKPHIQVAEQTGRRKGFLGNTLGSVSNFTYVMHVDSTNIVEGQKDLGWNQRYSTSLSD